MKNVSDKSCGENQNTYFVFSNPPPFFFENRVVYEIMWKNTVERGRLQMAIWNMRIACWVPKAMDTHSEYVNTYSFPLQQWLCERASILWNMYITFLVEIKKIGYSTSDIWFLTVRSEMTSPKYDNIKPIELSEFCVSWLCSWQSCCTKNREDSKCARIWQIRSSSRSNCQPYLLHALGLEDAACWASRMILRTDSYCFTEQHSLAGLCNGQSVCFCEVTTDLKKYYSPNLRPVQVISIRTPIRNEKQDWESRQKFFKLCLSVRLPVCLSVRLVHDNTMSCEVENSNVEGRFHERHYKWHTHILGMDPNRISRKNF
jgi:hypothetical protein